jgi:hypothetical protein
LFLCRVEKDYPPVARAGNDVVITLPENFVTLYGNGSTDDHVSHCSVVFGNVFVVLHYIVLYPMVVPDWTGLDWT